MNFQKYKKEDLGGERPTEVYKIRYFDSCVSLEGHQRSLQKRLRYLLKLSCAPYAMITELVFSRRGSTTLIWHDKLRAQSVGELNMFNVYFIGAAIYALIFKSQVVFKKLF